MVMLQSPRNGDGWLESETVHAKAVAQQTTGGERGLGLCSGDVVVCLRLGTWGT